MQTIKLTESQLNRIVLNTAKRIIKESNGFRRAGAKEGYEIEMDGFQSFNFTYQENPQNNSLIVTAQFNQLMLYWQAIGRYDSISTSDIRNPLMYGRKNRMIEGGEVSFEIDRSLCESVSQQKNISIDDVLQSLLELFSVEFRYDIDYVVNPFGSKNCTFTFHLGKQIVNCTGSIKINAPCIANAINSLTPNEDDF